jgi:NAD(P)-dependent dehydrogenase (short-subunit alcohol dehydrogenase family)
VVQIAITGGASGIARATAQLLASRGAILSLADVNQAGLDEALKLLKDHGEQKHTATVVDVRNSKAVDAWINETVSTHGRLDGAANLAGVFKNNTRILDTSDEQFAFHMDVNSTGLFYCVRAQLKALQKGGSIVRPSFASDSVVQRYVFGRQ